jgi:hypothetical protein
MIPGKLKAPIKPVVAHDGDASNFDEYQDTTTGSSAGGDLDLMLAELDVGDADANAEENHELSKALMKEFSS